MRTFRIVPNPKGGEDHAVASMMLKAGWLRSATLQGADVHVFTGGADVHPFMYRDVRHPTTNPNATRDLFEREIFKIASEGSNGGALKVGICRGAQFLNVMSGGKMFQDCDKHAIAGTHHCVYRYDGGKTVSVQVTSTHHQMMEPDEKAATMWGWTRLSTYRDRGRDRKKVVTNRANGLADPEIVWYGKTRSLCFQPHPEYGNEECRELFFQCLNRAWDLVEAQKHFR